MVDCARTLIPTAKESMSGRLTTFPMVTIAILLALTTVAHTQEPLWSRDRAFRIPFEVDPNDRARLREVQLFYSMDRGQTWQLYRGSPPEQPDFSFTARGDGEYWFTVRTIDRQGREYPPTMSRVSPQLRVYVDTTPPEVSLRTFNPVGNRVGVEWDILEEHLDLESLRLEFRSTGSRDWNPVQIDAKPRGSASWELGIPGPVEIRLRVLDYANNEGLKSVTLDAPTGIPAVAGSDGSRGVPSSPAQTNGFAIPSRPTPQDRSSYPARDDYSDSRPLQTLAPIADRPPRPLYSEMEDRRAASPGNIERSNRPAPANVRLVNSTYFAINYDVLDMGKSGLGSVKLFYTHDGMSWHYWGEDEDLESPFNVHVDGEGTYGFTMVVKNGAGLGDDEPAYGDPPQAWVEVDLTKPEVELDPPKPGVGASEGILFITWYVRDQNLEAKSIKLSYSDSTSGPWTTIKEGLENTGQWQWRMPENVPFKFYVQLEAKDRAGNVGRRITDTPVIVDLSRPKPRILGVEPTHRPTLSPDP